MDSKTWSYSLDIIVVVSRLLEEVLGAMAITLCLKT
jgi:hypothetical protein